MKQHHFTIALDRASVRNKDERSCGKAYRLHFVDDAIVNGDGGVITVPHIVGNASEMAAAQDKIFPESMRCALHLFNKGHDIIHRKGNDRLPLKRNAQRKILMLHKGQESLIHEGRLTIKPRCVARHFDGDIADSEVDIVGITRLLRRVCNTKVIELLFEFSFARPEMISGRRKFFVEGFFDKDVVGDVWTMLMQNLSSFFALFRGHTRILQLNRFAYSSRLETKIVCAIANHGTATAIMASDFVFSQSRIPHFSKFSFRDIIFVGFFPGKRGLNSSLLEVLRDGACADIKLFSQRDQFYSLRNGLAKIVNHGLSNLLSHKITSKNLFDANIAENDALHNCKCRYKAA